jgi:two-component system OmpR family sensor kinase
MKTGSLRARVTLVTLSLLVVVLVVVVTAVTVAYRSSLENDLRHHLSAAGTTVRRAGSANGAKQLVGGLALEGIATNIERAGQPLPAGKGRPGQLSPIKPGTSITSTGSLLVLDEVLPDGTRVTFTASNAPIDHAVTRLLVVEIVVALAALALAMLLVLRGTRRALQPLSQVIETASRIAAGDRRLRLRPTRPETELGSMATAFDRMVDALEEAATSAQHAESAMRRFLADASHELRTPVAALQASAESLLREQPERPRRDELEAALARQASRLGRLIDDLLSLARLEGADHPHEETVDLAALLRTAVEEARLRPTAATIRLTAQEMQVRGDANGLLRVVRNLLENALAAAPANGQIEVTAERQGTNVEVRVIDDGPGIRSADRERIFERFVRLNQRESTGTGLGLAIARQIARQHHGELTSDSIPSGASFTLRLPASGP